MKKDKTSKKNKQKKEKATQPETKKVASTSSIKDSNVKRADVKKRVTFLVGQFFRGRYYKAGDFIELPEADAQAYSKRSRLKIETI